MGRQTAFLAPFLNSALTKLRSCSAPMPHHTTAVNCSRMPMHLMSWKAVRRLWQLLYTTHCNILPCLMGRLSAADIIFMRTVNFVMRNLHNVNDVLCGIAQSVSNCMYSHTCCTLARFALRFPGKHARQLPSLLSAARDWAHDSLLLELCLVRCGRINLDLLSFADVHDITVEVACS